MTNKAFSTDATLRPLRGRVVIRRDLDDPEAPKREIYVPDSAKDRSRVGTVVAVGPGRVSPKTGERLPMTLKPGDRVIFPRWGGSDVKPSDPREEPEYLTIKEEDVYGVIEDD